MREIKFRGLVKGIGDIKRWAYGGIFYIGKRTFVVLDDVEITEDWDGNSAITDFVEVIPETVGEYTGSHDKKNDKEIYEGDIVEFMIDGVKEISEVFFEAGGFSVNARNTDPGYKPYLDEVSDIAKVIGNKWENSELLKKGEL